MPKPRKSGAAAESKFTVVGIDKEVYSKLRLPLKKLKQITLLTVSINSTKFEKTSGEEKG